MHLDAGFAQRPFEVAPGSARCGIGEEGHIVERGYVAGVDVCVLHHSVFTSFTEARLRVHDHRDALFVQAPKRSLARYQRHVLRDRFARRDQHDAIVKLVQQLG